MKVDCKASKRARKIPGEDVTGAKGSVFVNLRNSGNLKIGAPGGVRDLRHHLQHTTKRRLN